MSLSGAEADFLKANEPRRVLVNSIQKSGTTWVRTMLAALPGYAEYPREGISGTRYEELLDVEPGQIFHGHIMSSEPLFEIMDERVFTTVFVYRDLRDVVVSTYFHLTDLNPGRAPDVFWEMEKEQLFRADNLPKWCVGLLRYPDIRVWLERDDVPTVRYEDLKADTVGELTRVLERMNFEVEAALVDAIVEGTTFEAISGRRVGEEDPASPLRKGIIGDWRNHFSEQNLKDFKARYGDLLIEFGYESDYDW